MSASTFAYPAAGVSMGGSTLHHYNHDGTDHRIRRSVSNRMKKCSFESAKRDIFQVSFAETLAQFGRLHEKAKFLEINPSFESAPNSSVIAHLGISLSARGEILSAPVKRKPLVRNPLCKFAPTQ
jgi:hypothetical protein